MLSRQHYYISTLSHINLFLYFSYERVGAVPFQFQLGIGAVIKGWEIGLLDMCATEKRRLTVPSNLAYGEKGSGNFQK